MQFNYGILGEQGQTMLYDYYFKSLLARLNQLFTWDNLPDTVDRDYLNAALFLNGFAAFFKHGGNLYCGVGGLGGSPDEYYFSTLYTLANPVLGSAQYEIHKECELIYNTSADKQLMHLAGSGGGLYALIDQTATMLTDNAQSINTAQINSRVQTVFTADNDRQKKAADVYLKRLYTGEPYSAITSDELQRFSTQNITVDTDKTITPLVELHQHILADFYNQIGIQTTPYNKAERLITAEVDTVGKMTDCTLNSMLRARQDGIKSVNAMFGTDINVHLAEWLLTNVKDEPDPDPEPAPESDQGWESEYMGGINGG